MTVLATVFEAQDGVRQPASINGPLLTDTQPVSVLASTLGAALITAPPTPVLPHNGSSQATFVKQLSRALQRVCWRQNIRRQLYGEDTADMFRVGHTPPAVKKRAITTVDDDGTTTDEDAPRFDIWSYMPDWRRRRRQNANSDQIKQRSNQTHLVKQGRGASIVSCSRSPGRSEVTDEAFERPTRIKRKREDGADNEDSGGLRPARKGNILASPYTKGRSKILRAI